MDEVVSVEHYWKDTDRVKPVLLGENGVPMTLHLPQILQELAHDWPGATGVRGQRLTTCFHGTA
jgi:hypothetical protein